MNGNQTKRLETEDFEQKWLNFVQFYDKTRANTFVEPNNFLLHLSHKATQLCTKIRKNNERLRLYDWNARTYVSTNKSEMIVPECLIPGEYELLPVIQNVFIEY